VLIFDVDIDPKEKRQAEEVEELLQTVISTVSLLIAYHRHSRHLLFQ
jgi:hypothetical protein